MYADKSVTRQRKTAIIDWAVLLGVCISAVAVCETVGLDPMWRDGVVYTVILFATIVSALRPAWRRKSFWTSLGLIWAGHTILLVGILQALPARRHGLPKLLLIPIALIEGSLILAILWKRMKALRLSSSQ